MTNEKAAQIANEPQGHEEFELRRQALYRVQDKLSQGLAEKWEITVESVKLFIAFANDAGNWSGTPLVGGNVTVSSETRGNLTQLKRRGLVRTFSDEGQIWMEFTAKGVMLAADALIDLRYCLRDSEEIDVVDCAGTPSSELIRSAKAAAIVLELLAADRMAAEAEKAAVLEAGAAEAAALQKAMDEAAPGTPVVLVILGELQAERDAEARRLQNERRLQKTIEKIEEEAIIAGAALGSVERNVLGAKEAIEGSASRTLASFYLGRALVHWEEFADSQGTAKSLFLNSTRGISPQAFVALEKRISGNAVLATALATNIRSLAGYLGLPGKLLHSVDLFERW